MILAALLLHGVSGSFSWIPVVAASTQEPPTRMAESSSEEILFNTNYRSTTDIVWSCIVTIFACTWLSVHPNVSGTDTAWKRRMMHRISLMLWGIAAPEFLVIFAYRQWKGSRDITRAIHQLVKEDKLDLPLRKSWTNAHSHFLQMGGFMFQLPQGDDTPHFIDVQELVQHSQEVGKEALIVLLKRSPTEDEIWDKSKGDTLAKGIVALQTTWFLAQILGRAAQRLTITELEVITLAYAAFNAAMYAFWWDKPLDVQCPILVPFAGLRELQLYQVPSMAESISNIDFAQLADERTSLPTSYITPRTNHTPQLPPRTLCRRSTT
ncbi:hypothetical protein BKA70DRAFT_752266 [Coprinopsis sp. MPI-PUGE-AT-0042]|nr:hypothetical protein BKA70DRAFT_752266 [Coprinopsis sp. MPI-PUGE-AT-0042]